MKKLFVLIFLFMATNAFADIFDTGKALTFELCQNKECSQIDQKTKIVFEAHIADKNSHVQSGQGMYFNLEKWKYQQHQWVVAGHQQAVIEWEKINDTVHLVFPTLKNEAKIFNLTKDNLLIEVVTPGNMHQKIFRLR